MDLKKLSAEDSNRGVSPVIGVILMVAITVILAAVIGAFVLGLGDQVSNNAPQASFEYDFNGTHDLTITHGGGDDIERDTLDVTITGTSVYPDNSTVGNSTGWDQDTLSTGSTLDIYRNQSGSAEGYEAGDTVRVIWNNPSGGSSNTLSERDVPT